MKKSQQERLNASLDKALDPPRKKPKQDLDALLKEYDDGQGLNARGRAVSGITTGIPDGIPSTIPTGIPDGIPIPSPEATLDTLTGEGPKEAAQQGETNTAHKYLKKPRRTVAVTSEDAEEQSQADTFIPVDATHTASEKAIYSLMYRETLSKGRQEGHFGPALLMKLSGIRSRNTVHKALYGLIEKLSVEKVADTMGNPFGPRYRVYGPQEILRRRKAAGMVIDTQTKRIIEGAGIPEGIPATIPDGIPSAIPKNWDTPIPKIGIPTIPKIGILYKKENNTDVEQIAEGSSSNVLAQNADDEAFADFLKILKQTAREISGSDPLPVERERWGEVGEILATELKIAASRTSVTSVPAFLAAHLSRRLSKRDQQQIDREIEEAREAESHEALAKSKYPQLTSEQIQEQVNLVVELLRGGETIESLDGRLAVNFTPMQWQIIRGIAMAQFKVVGK